MRKIVTTEMKDKSVFIAVCVTPDACGSIESQHLRFEFPFDVVNPRIALQIATLLVSDPTIPASNEKEEE